MWCENLWPKFSRDNIYTQFCVICHPCTDLLSQIRAQFCAISVAMYFTTSKIAANVLERSHTKRIVVLYNFVNTIWLFDHHSICFKHSVSFINSIFFMVCLDTINCFSQVLTRIIISCILVITDYILIRM